jgi:predicted sulfurtransferase
LTPVDQLTEIITQILNVNHLADINLGSEAGRHIVAATIASQMVDGHDVLVVDVQNASDAERQEIDAALMPDSEHVYN